MPFADLLLAIALFSPLGGPAPAEPPLTYAARDSTRLVVPPLVLRPTADGVTVNVVFEGAPGGVGLDYRKAGDEGDWTNGGSPAAHGADVLEWRITGLEPATRYVYRVRTTGAARSEARGSFVTRRPPGQPFTFALITDPHILVRDFTEEELRASPLPESVVERYATAENARWTLRMYRAYGHAMLPRVARQVLEDGPDFVINLGDIIDLHGFGFNIPVPEPRWARKGFLDYRRLLGPLGSRAPHFWVIGNWDGEKGHFTEEERLRSRGPRLRYLPNPASDTYPEGGGANQDYYAFRWGDALFLVLNVVSYTPTEHLLDRKKDPGRPDDHTLGKEQLAWLEKTLAGATSRWKFLCIHHPVGGCGGDDRNSAYGRGGGRAAQVGEQARVHALMQQHGAQALFYGHDHVFTDMVVDGVHYTLPGSAGAPWKFTTRETGYDRYWSESGYARVQVGPKRVVITFISADKQVLFRFLIKAPRE